MEEIKLTVYQAEQGKIFKRNSDGFYMGDVISMSDKDSIDNYTQVKLTSTVKTKVKEQLDNYNISYDLDEH